METLTGAEISRREMRLTPEVPTAGTGICRDWWLDGCRGYVGWAPAPCGNCGCGYAKHY